jgi:hypothetical protein
VQAGKVKIAEGVTVAVSDKEKELALTASDKFALNERDAVVLLRSRRIDQGGLPDEVGADEDASSELFWDTFATFLLNERHQAVGLGTQMMLIGASLASACSGQRLQRCAADADDDMMPSTAAELSAKRIQRLDKGELAASCIRAFSARCLEPMPEPLRNMARRGAFWAKQLVREQIDLLGLAFLCYHQHSADGKAARAVLEAAERTEWGTQQANAAFFDADAQAETGHVEHLLSLLSIAALNLDITALPETFSADDPPAEAAALLHPATLRSVHASVLKLVSVNPAQAAPLLLGWSLVLYRLVQAFGEAEAPKAYDDFRIEVDDTTYQRAVSHALDPRCALFPTLQQIVASPLTSHRLATGYLDVLRGLLATVPQMLFIGHLHEDQYAAYLSTLCQLYARPTAEPLRLRFWRGGDAVTDAEQSLLLQVCPSQVDSHQPMLTEYTGRAALSCTGPRHPSSPHRPRRAGHLRPLRQAPRINMRRTAFVAVRHACKRHDLHEPVDQHIALRYRALSRSGPYNFAAGRSTADRLLGHAARRLVGMGTPRRRAGRGRWHACADSGGRARERRRLCRGTASAAVAR